MENNDDDDDDDEYSFWGMTESDFLSVRIVPAKELHEKTVK